MAVRQFCFLTAVYAAALLVAVPASAIEPAPPPPLNITAPPDSFDSIWRLPVRINDLNTTISFEVDSTWHTVHGTVSGVAGELHQPDGTNDLTLIAGGVKIPVAKFSTGNSSRDARLREVMAADRFPEVAFMPKTVIANCDPKSLRLNENCPASVQGALKIRDVSSDVEIPIVINRAGKHWVVTGEYSFDWADFHIEDPSTFYASLESTVTVSFRLAW